MQATDTLPEATAVDEDLARARRKKAAVLELIRKTGRNGLNAAGMIKDTPLAREAFALGEAYRRPQTYP
ncbi:MAG: hypothetical protein IPK22_19925 [Verrucomicrobiaceae bacterium]|nr:hypothetical protein [Verrucomicrobiaceae bacterium]